MTTKPENVITFRNPAIIEWLKEQGVEGTLMHYVKPADIAHKHVYGHLPYWLAAYADRVSEVSLPRLARADRDRFNDGDITTQEMDAAGAYVATYQVRNAG